MTRSALAHLAAAFGLGAGFAVGLAFAEVGWATLAFAAAIILAILTTGLSVMLARRLDHRVASRLEAIGAAVGHKQMRRGQEVDYVEGIVSVLHQSLQRASAVKNGVTQSSLPMALLTEDGEIATASAGLISLGPQFERGAQFPDFARIAEAGGGVTTIGDTRYRVEIAEESGSRRVVSLVSESLMVEPGFFDAVSEAMISGAPDKTLAEHIRALGPDAKALLRGFEALGDGLKLMDGVLDGNQAAFAAAARRNDALGARARAMADLISAFAANQQEEEEFRAKLETKLKRIGDLVDRHREMAAKLRDGANEIRGDHDVLNATLDTGGERAEQARALGRQARAAIDEAAVAARINNDAAASLGELTSEISSLVTAIEEVSFRTNLIALNASVEAARAGDKGAGFAVVADEVRTLAQSASQTAKEIKTLVGRGREKSEDGVAGAAGLENLISDLDDHLRNLSNETDKIADVLSQGRGVLARMETRTAAIADDADRATGGAHPRVASNTRSSVA